jgi:hypothetical protein
MPQTASNCHELFFNHGLTRINADYSNTKQFRPCSLRLKRKIIIDFVGGILYAPNGAVGAG